MLYNKYLDGKPALPIEQKAPFMIKEETYDPLNLRKDEKPPVGEGINWTEMARTQFDKPSSDKPSSDKEDLDFNALTELDANQSVALRLFISDVTRGVVTPDNYQDRIDQLVEASGMTDDEIHLYIADAVHSHLYDDELANIDESVYRKLTKSLDLVS